MAVKVSSESVVLGIDRDQRVQPLGYLTTSAPVVPAETRNEAGIVGAALSARLKFPPDLA